jgi:hypothetical protein
MHVLQSTDAQVQVVPTGVVVTNPPSNVIKIAIKNNQSNDAFFFSAPVSLPVLFTEAGQLERSAYLSMWKSIPDANESTKDIPLNAGPTDLDFLIRYLPLFHLYLFSPLCSFRYVKTNTSNSLHRKLTSRNLFEIARRKVNDQDVVYLSVKTENSVYILVELTFKYGIRQCKCSCKTSSLELVAYFEQAIEQMLNQ